jgi:putative component of toxin-antitoxin plasmid stabilization module
VINKIMDGISEKLGNHFGDGYKIYTENVKRG